MSETRICLLLTIIVLTGALAVACSDQVPVPKPIIRPVRTLKVARAETSGFRTFSGTAKAGVESKLSFKVGGTIRSLAVKVGDNVNAGDNIAQLDTKGFKLQVQEARARVAQASAQARSAKARYARVRRLYESRTASKDDLDSARAASDSARAQVAALSRRVQSAQEQLKDAQLTAPSAGVISAVLAEVNENVKPTQPIVTLSSGGDPEVVTSVPTALIDKVKRGDKVKVTFSDIPDKTFDGRVSTVGVATEGIGGTIPVTVKLLKPGMSIRSGITAKVAFTFEYAQKGVRFFLPAAAVAEDHRGRFVFLVDVGPEAGRGKTRRQAVQVGEFTRGQVEVLSGIREGDLVVTAGVSRIRHGQVVKLLGESK